MSEVRVYVNGYNKDTTPIYVSAYGGEQYAVWGSIDEFNNQIDETCYYRALSSFIRNNSLGEDDRRKLLYSYMSCSGYAIDEADDPLNKMYPALSTNNMYLTRALNNLCVLYLDEPERIFEEIQENKEIQIRDLLRNSKYNKFMLNLHRAFKLCGEVIARPLLIDNQLVHRFYTPDLYRYIYDELDRPLQLWIPFHQKIEGYKQPQVRFHVWDKDLYRRADARGRFIKFTYQNKEVFEYPHKYGRIPFVRLSVNELSDYIGGSLWELAKAQLFCNKIDFSIDENVTYNGFSMFLFVNMDIRNNRTKIGPGRALIQEKVMVGEGLEAAPYAETISPSPQYNEIDDLKQKYIRQTLKSLGLPTSVIDDQTQNISGAAIREDRRELENMRKEDIVEFNKFENEYINLMLQVMNTDLNAGFLPVKVNIDYQEQAVFTETKDEFALDYELYTKGLYKPMDFVKKWSGNDLITTDEEAIEFINMNKELINGNQGETFAGSDRLGTSTTGNGESGGFTENGEPNQTDQFSKQGN